MTKSVYKVFLAKPTEAWHRLSEDELENLISENARAFESVGAKTIITGDCGWSSEQWAFFGVEEFPNIEAVQKYSELLDEIDWLRYVDSMTVLGTKSPES